MEPLKKSVFTILRSYLNDFLSLHRSLAERRALLLAASQSFYKR